MAIFACILSTGAPPRPQHKARQLQLRLLCALPEWTAWTAL